MEVNLTRQLCSTSMVINTGSSKISGRQRFQNHFAACVASRQATDFILVVFQVVPCHWVQEELNINHQASMHVALSSSVAGDHNSHQPIT